MQLINLIWTPKGETKPYFTKNVENNNFHQTPEGHRIFAAFTWQVLAY